MPQERSIFHILRDLVVFRAGAPTWQNYPRKTGALTGGYRSPSPGSQRPAYVPARERDDLFNTQYYTRNTRKFAPEAPPPALRAESFQQPQQALKIEGGSKGRKNPAVERYDPTMTRSAMTTSWAAVRTEVAHWLPNHLPHPWWLAEKHKARVEEVKQHCLKNNIREPFGVPKKSLGSPRYENHW